MGAVGKGWALCVAKWVGVGGRRQGSSRVLERGPPEMDSGPGGRGSLTHDPSASPKFRGLRCRISGGTGGEKEEGRGGRPVGRVRGMDPGRTVGRVSTQEDGIRRGGDGIGEGRVAVGARGGDSEPVRRSGGWERVPGEKRLDGSEWGQRSPCFSPPTGTQGRGVVYDGGPDRVRRHRSLGRVSPRRPVSLGTPVAPQSTRPQPDTAGRHGSDTTLGDSLSPPSSGAVRTLPVRPGSFHSDHTSMGGDGSLGSTGPRSRNGELTPDVSLASAR